ncbi:MAG: 16S rRNA (uracil(1498)-N(3))-methyltransferase [Acidimicrobiia bacterium]|nr:16S rRNA (uracil(1498)-N(3))-methyltransferase [Acidimicrobiia bacterium]
MPHAYVADVASPELTAQDRHHLQRVLRTRVGEAVTVSDGVGGWRECRLGAGGRLEAVSLPTVVARPQPSVTVGIAVTKGARPEVAVQKLTELGVDRIVPFLAERSVARWQPERAAHHVERLRRVAREAGVQARLAHLPAIDELATFDDAAALVGAALAVPGGEPPAHAGQVLLIGPEGGWTQDELATGLPRVALGPTTLRAETAAIAAGTLLTALRSGAVVARGRSNA